MEQFALIKRYDRLDYNLAVAQQTNAKIVANAILNSPSYIEFMADDENSQKFANIDRRLKYIIE